ncbi:type I-C CRISPR-associated protein Cas5c [Desulfosarcina ovata]|uniref:pre-crRNA processing endonuclease n=2 Tax=Desulfosarcina ovata TaxID=83564 RepID=A0A5K8A3Y8_9BACT|nr:type I-C CRISPR-associated protein Cas5c [Desulfosarcina ovata]BBO79960.1 type I-C CRISPR-associated protein Cas5 [Desulfosarcina ovata subsp. sediminis]BBO87262.1 type I-C CRISPR-associated protein Cas5 [Desulfosarcina ovata subsp. ovata]
MNKSSPFRLKVSGPNACFTRPEMKVERVSYDVMTPSAARGILEAILWKPAIFWKILQIDVMNPIKWESVRRNEVGAVVSARNAKTAMREGSGFLGLYIEKERQQRAGLFLRDVAYVIHAEFELTARAGPEDNVVKFEQMFIRRASQGQCFHRPYFGCREFPVDFEFIPKDASDLPAIAKTHDFGWMLHDIDYSGKEPMPQFFNAKMVNGKIDLRNVEVRS